MFKLKEVLCNSKLIYVCLHLWQGNMINPERHKSTAVDKGRKEEIKEMKTLLLCSGYHSCSDAVCFFFLWSNKEEDDQFAKEIHKKIVSRWEALSSWFFLTLAFLYLLLWSRQIFYLYSQVHPMDESDLRYLIWLKSKQVLILELYGRESLENCIIYITKQS